MRTDDARPGHLVSTTSSGPVRTCIGCRERDARDHLVRVVLDPDTPTRAVVDERRVRPGRGAWLHATDACLTQADRRRALRRALRAAGEVSTDAIRTWMKNRRGVPQDAAENPH